MGARIPIAAAFLLAAAAILLGCGSSGGATTGTGSAEARNGGESTGAPGGGNGGEATSSPGGAGPAPAPEGAGPGPGARGQSGGPSGIRARTCQAEHVEELRATGTDCATANRVTAEWVAEASCRPSAEASKSACSVGGFRCLSTVTGRGVAAFCVQPGRAVAFIAKAE